MSFEECESWNIFVSKKYISQMDKSHGIRNEKKNSQKK